MDDEVRTNRWVLTVTRGVFAGLDLDGTQASVLGSTDVRFDVIPDHHHFVRVETEIIEFALGLP